MIRVANKNDINEIIVIGKELYKNFNSIYDLLAYIENDKYLIYVNDEEGINGFLIAYENIDECELLCIVVKSEYRNQKIGTKLLGYLINRSCNPIFLEVSDNNKVAIDLYHRFNFQEIGFRKKYYQDGSNAILMKLVK